MNALVLCGGQGSRLANDTEKPLLTVAGRPMVDRVFDALAAARRVDAVFAATSPNAPETAASVQGVDGVQTIETPGEGYVNDLGTAIDAVGTPVLTVAADLPLLAGRHVDDVVAAARACGSEETTASVTVRTPARLKRQLGVSVDESTAEDGGGDDDAGIDAEEWIPTGLNVVGEADSVTRRSWDARLAVNVNYQRDATVAESLAGTSPAGGDA